MKNVQYSTQLTMYFKLDGSCTYTIVANTRRDLIKRMESEIEREKDAELITFGAINKIVTTSEPRGFKHQYCKITNKYIKYDMMKKYIKSLDKI